MEHFAKQNWDIIKSMKLKEVKGRKMKSNFHTFTMPYGSHSKINL